MSLAVIVICLSLALGSARAIDLILSNAQKRRLLAATETLTLRVAYAKPIALFSAVARPPIPQAIAALFLLSSYPLYRSVVLPLVRFATPGEAVTFVSAAILSLFAAHSSGHFASALLDELSGRPERERGVPFTVPLFLLRLAKATAILTGAFFVQAAFAYAAFWILIVRWLGEEVPIGRFALATAWPWIYYLLSILPGASLALVALLLQRALGLILLLSRFLLWRMVEYKSGPIAYIITLLVFIGSILAFFLSRR